VHSISPIYVCVLKLVSGTVSILAAYLYHVELKDTCTFISHVYISDFPTHSFHSLGGLKEHAVFEFWRRMVWKLW